MDSGRSGIRLGLLIGVVFAALLVAPGLASAATITVTGGALDANSSGDGDCSLREAVISANQDANTPQDIDDCVIGTGQDEIVVPAGQNTLTLSGLPDDTSILGDLDILDADGLTITGAGATTDLTQTGIAERILDGNNAPLTMTNLTVSDGVDTTGGNIRFRGAAGDTLKLTGVTVEDGVASAGGGSLGGGILIGGGGAGSGLELDDSTVEDNKANTDTGIGGGIQVSGGVHPLTITDSEVKNNEAGVGGTQGIGGGISFRGDAALTLTNVDLTGNKAGGGSSAGSVGGGAEINFNGMPFPVDITDSNISNNTAGHSADSASGGGLYFQDGSPTAHTVTIDGSTIAGNKAAQDTDTTHTGRGGGLHFDITATRLTNLTVSDTTIANNVAGTHPTLANTLGLGEGGGIWASTDGTVQVSDSTVSGNSAATRGGGILRADPSLTPNTVKDSVTRTTIAGNQVATAFTNPSGGGVVWDVDDSVTFDRTTISGNTTEGLTPVVGSSFAAGILLDPTSGSAGDYDFTNSTISGNRALGSGNGGQAGGLFVDNSTESVDITSSTIAFNEAELEAGFGGSAGNIDAQGNVGQVRVAGSIISDGIGNPFGQNCSQDQPQVIDSLGGNVEGPPSVAPTGQCSFDQPMDAIGISPLLAPLSPANGGDPANGIPTATHALGAGSTAINRVPAGLCPPPAIDQRGLARPQGPACDSGAFEVFMDTLAPNTLLGSSKIKRARRTATFKFSSTEPGSTFLCKIDKKPFRSCTSPKKYKRLKRGKHRFQVQAKDAAGNLDGSPAVKKFRI